MFKKQLASTLLSAVLLLLFPYQAQAEQQRQKGIVSEITYVDHSIEDFDVKSESNPNNEYFLSSCDLEYYVSIGLSKNLWRTVRKWDRIRSIQLRTFNDYVYYTEGEIENKIYDAIFNLVTPEHYLFLGKYMKRSIIYPKSRDDLIDLLFAGRFKKDKTHEIRVKINLKDNSFEDRILMSCDKII